MRKKTILFIALSLAIFTLSQCSDEDAVGPDLDLYNEATATSGFTYYQGNTAIRQSSSASGHRPYMRVRFNAIAQSALGLDGRLPSGSTFPNGSMIVKELYDNPVGPIIQYAVMKKDSLNTYAGNFWLWGEYYSESSVAISVTENGVQCTSCHSTDSRDFVRVFNIF